MRGDETRRKRPERDESIASRASMGMRTVLNLLGTVFTPRASSRVLHGLVALLAAAGFFAGALIFLHQIFHWLRLGVWPPLVMMDGLRELGIARPTVEWIGVQKLIDEFLFGCPLSLGLFGLAFIASSIAQRIKQDIESNEAQFQLLDIVGLFCLVVLGMVAWDHWH
jgi:hypothetical protein